MPITVKRNATLSSRSILVYRDGVPCPPEPYPVSVQEYHLAHRPGVPEVFTKGMLYYAKLPTVEGWMATLVVMNVKGLSATYTIGATYQVAFPDDIYDHKYDNELEQLLRGELST